MGDVIALHRQPLFRKVVLIERDERVHTFLAGPVWGGKSRPFRWVGSLPAEDKEAIRARARAVAEKFALDMIEDRSGCVDDRRGPARYSLKGGAI